MYSVAGWVVDYYFSAIRSTDPLKLLGSPDCPAPSTRSGQTPTSGFVYSWRTPCIAGISNMQAHIQLVSLSSDIRQNPREEIQVTPRQL